MIWVTNPTVAAGDDAHSAAKNSLENDPRITAPQPTRWLTNTSWSREAGVRDTSGKRVERVDHKARTRSWNAARRTGSDKFSQKAHPSSKPPRK